LPADGFNVLAVGSLTVTDEIASSSSIGPTADGRVKPDLVAPGENVLALDVAMTTGYSRVSGTSFAAPTVAGAAALLLEKNPTWTPADVKHALTWSAEDILEPGPDNYSGWGVMNADLALEEIIHSGIVGRAVATVRGADGNMKGVPAVGVRVELLSSGSGEQLAASRTDLRGRFSFANQANGAFVLRFTHSGLSALDTSVSIPQIAPILVNLSSGTAGGGARYRIVPNPVQANTGVTIAGIAHPDLVARFYDMSGRLVRELAPQQVYWDLTTSGGQPVAGGVYFCRVEIAGAEVWRGKVAVVR
jgi:subtilisin family serine protease